MAYPRTRPPRSPDEEGFVEPGEADVFDESKHATDVVSWRSFPYRKVLVYGLLALLTVWAAFALTTEVGRLLAVWAGIFALVILLPLGVIRLVVD